MINDFNQSSIEMYEWACASCGCVQWMPKDFNDQLQRTHQGFFCVNGHGNIYNKKTDIEEIAGKLANEYAKNAQLEARITQLEKDIAKLEKSFFKRLF